MSAILNEIYEEITRNSGENAKLYKSILNNLKKSEFSVENYKKLLENQNLKKNDSVLLKKFEEYESHLTLMNEIVFSLFEIPDVIKNEISNYSF